MEKLKKNNIYTIILYVILVILCFPMALIVGYIHFFIYTQKNKEVLKKQINSITDIQNKNVKTENKISQIKTTVKEQKKFIIPSNIKNYFSEDELYEIEYFMNSERNHFDREYDITDEWYQDYFKKAKANEFETISINSDLKYSVIKKDKKHYFASLTGCSCKGFEEDGFCSHMIVNAINQNIINPVNGIKVNDKELKPQLDFIYENIINSPENLLKVKTGLIKQSKISKYFKEKGFLNISTDIEDLVSCFSKDELKDFIPTLKTDIKNINPELKISYLKINELREFIIQNQDSFQKYFNDYALVEIKEEIEEKVSDCEELANWITYTQQKYQ